MKIQLYEGEGVRVTGSIECERGAADDVVQALQKLSHQSMVTGELQPR